MKDDGVGVTIFCVFVLLFLMGLFFVFYFDLRVLSFFVVCSDLRRIVAAILSRPFTEMDEELHRLLLQRWYLEGYLLRPSRPEMDVF